MLLKYAVNFLQPVPDNRAITNSTAAVPVRYCVPHEPPWSEHLWGFPLGEKLYQIRTDHL
eukprot:11334-Heterococcus_DN1.PRE.1